MAEDRPASAPVTTAATAAQACERWLLPTLPSLLRGADGADWRRWLGRATRLADGGFGPRHALAEALGQPLLELPWVRSQARADLPAALADTAVFRADRIRTRVDGFALRLIGLNDAPLAVDLQRQVGEIVAELFGDSGLRLQAGAEGRQYLCGSLVGELEGPDVAPPDALFGTNLADAMPPTLRWRRLLNELQICLNQTDPGQAGRSIVQADGLWFWGDARAEIAQLPEPGWSAVEDDEIALLLDLLGWGAKAEGGLVGLREGPTARPDAIASALGNGPLLLCCASGERFVLRPRDRWRFWRAPWTEATS